MQRRWNKTVIWIALLVSAYSLALGIGLSRHELWRDEAKAWLIARDSTSLADLYHNRRYEGHPILWYIPLYAVSRITRNPAGMQVVHAFIAAAGVLVFALRAPFSRTQKVLFAAGLFPLFEYGVVSRSYSLGLLLLMILLTLFDPVDPNVRRPLRVAILLVLLANTHLYGLLIAVAYAAAWIVREPASLTRRDAMAFMLVIAGFAAAVWQIVPPSPVDRDAGRFSSVYEARFGGTAWQLAAGSIADAYLPIPNFNEYGLYTSIVPPTSRVARISRLAVALIFVIGGAWSLRRSKAALVFYLVATSLILSLTWLKFSGQLRHHGQFFIVFIAACWIAMQARQLPRWGSVSLSVLLAVHALVGLYYWQRDLRQPYSPSWQAAQLLHERYGRNFYLVANPGNYFSPVQAYLDIPVFFPARRALGSFELLDGTPKSVPADELLTAVRELAEKSDRPIILMTLDPIDFPDLAIRFMPLASLRQSLCSEAYEIYEVKRPLSPVINPLRAP